MMESTTLKTAPVDKLFELEEVKAVIGLLSEQTQFDALLSALINSAISFFENETNMKVIEQTWYGYLEDWPLEEDFIEISYPPLQSITSIKYIDSGGNTNTWNSSEYVVDINIEPGRVYLGWLKNWPTAILAPKSNAIVIEFVCGYSDVSLVPENIKNCVKLLVDFWFNNRGVDSAKIPESIMSAIKRHKVYYIKN